MSNQLCLVVPIKKKDYELISSRISAFSLTSLGTKQLQLSISLYLPQQTRKPQSQSQKPVRRQQHTLVRLSDATTSTYLIPNQSCPSLHVHLGSNSNINVGMGVGVAVDQKNKEKFIEEATYLRCDNSFKYIVKGWSIFGDLKEIYSKVIDIQVYEWKDVNVLEFLHTNDEQVLLIIRDVTSSSFARRDKDKQKDVLFSRDAWYKKFHYCFQDILLTLGAIYKQYKQSKQQGSERSQLSQTISPRKQKQLQYEQRLNQYINKLKRFTQKQQQKSQASTSSSSLSAPFTGLAALTSNQQQFSKPLEFWIVRIGAIVEFCLRELQVKREDKSKDKDKEKDKESRKVQGIQEKEKEPEKNEQVRREVEQEGAMIDQN